MKIIHKILTFLKIILIFGIIFIKFNFIPKTMPFINIIEYTFKILVAIFCNGYKQSF